ncbi:hypothetical protein EBI_27402 [Enterocytozoon bieneusi H348]|nr:hypothetical protein EBI_27402 [Enterocytozoon bieneusi H348]|eukprot:XP_002650914.1 hypothetical protein EBI_27402 [Enterocytozoon bieneusi H348]
MCYKKKKLGWGGEPTNFVVGVFIGEGDYFPAFFLKKKKYFFFF